MLFTFCFFQETLMNRLKCLTEFSYSIFNNLALIMLTLVAYMTKEESASSKYLICPTGQYLWTGRLKFINSAANGVA